MSQLTLQNEGILIFKSNYVIKQPLVTIHGHKVYSTIKEGYYIPSFNLSDVFATHNLTPDLRYQHHYAPHIRELEDLKKTLVEMDKQIPIIIRHATHYYGLGYGTFAIAIAAIGCLLWMLIRIRRLAEPSPVNAENTTGHQDVKISDDA